MSLLRWKAWHVCMGLSAGSDHASQDASMNYFAFAFVLILIGQMIFRMHVRIDTSPRISLSLSLSHRATIGGRQKGVDHSQLFSVTFW